MSKRLRHQEVTLKPRIYIDGDSFRVEYFGPCTQGHCGVGFRTFEAAIEHGNKVARCNPDEVRAINTRRDQARHIRRAARLGLSVAA